MMQRKRAFGWRTLMGAAALLCALGTLQPSLAQESTPPLSDSELAAQLPPADLPTMNQQGFVFELESTFTGTLSAAPSEAPVYQMAIQQQDQASVSEIASRLGINGDVADQGGGNFAVEGDGSLFVTPGLAQYISDAALPEGELPADDEAIAYAREWLRQTQLLPANIGTGAVETRVESPARVIVTFKPIEPAPLLSSNPGITVTMGPNGAILEASFRWAELRAIDVYQLREAQAAWLEVSERRAYLQADIPSDILPQGSAITGSVEYSAISLAYTTSGIPGEAQYLQPVFVFTGELAVEDSDQAFPITAYVPALVSSEEPVG